MNIGHIICIAVVSILPQSVMASSAELLEGMERLHEPRVDTIAYPVEDVKLAHTDMVLAIESGVFYPFETITLNGTAIVPGGYFTGKAVFSFQPEPSAERHQMRLFFDSDTVEYEVESFVLFGDRYFVDQLTAAKAVTPPEERKDNNKRVMEEHKRLIKDESRSFTYWTLKNLRHDIQGRYLLINTKPARERRVVWVYNPMTREEVGFWKHYFEPGYDFLERVCSYGAEVGDENYALNGPDRSEIDITHYETDVFINYNSDFTCMATVVFTSRETDPLMLNFHLHPRLEIDSIRDSRGDTVEFLRWEDEDHRNPELYVFLNEAAKTESSNQLTFYYHGDIIRFSYGHFHVGVGASWYPRYTSEYCTFDMTFRIHDELDFVACGRKVDEQIAGDTVVSKWIIDRPVRSASFNVGVFERYTFDDTSAVPIEIYINEEYHRGWGTRNIENTISVDVRNSLELFSENFGPYEYDRIIVSEIIAQHGQAFPGFVHLGMPTWVKTDFFGQDNIFRAHEVAHQWWGVGVGYDTYHDLWLSEGFAEYSGLMYLQSLSGNERFYDKLKRYRDEIFHEDMAGPLSLGTRVATTRTREAYTPIVYRKGAYVLHMLRCLMRDLTTRNDGEFFNMMAGWYSANREERPSTRDFKAHVEKYVGSDMTWFFDQWIFESKLPEYEFEYDISKNEQGEYIAECRIETDGVGDSFMMPVPIEIEFDKGPAVYHRVMVDDSTMAITLPPFDRKPKQLRFNAFQAVLAKVDQ